MSEKLKIALISGVVSIATAAITAFAPVFGTVVRTETAAKQAKASAEQSSVALEKTRQAIKALPGALATHYRGDKYQKNNGDERFNFSKKIYDPQSAVQVGNDWRLIAPVSGIYYIGANYSIPYAKDYITPYVKCQFFKVPEGATAQEQINISIAFTPSCSLSGVFRLNKGDQIYTVLGVAGAAYGEISGEFFSVFVGDGEQ